MKKIFYACSFVLLLFYSASVHATLISYTDNETHEGFNINYKLEYEQLNSTEYSAKFTIDSTNSNHEGDWYAGGISLKFFEGAFDTILTFDGTTNEWNIAAPGVTHIDGWSVTSNWAGIYHVDAGQTFDLLDENTRFTVGDVRTFNLTFKGEGIPYTDEMPFRVGYWDSFAGQSENALFNQLSAKLKAVPEPSSMLLLSFGIAGLFAFCRRYRQT